MNTTIYKFSQIIFEIILIFLINKTTSISMKIKKPQSKKELTKSISTLITT